MVLIVFIALLVALLVLALIAYVLIERWAGRFLIQQANVAAAVACATQTKARSASSSAEHRPLDPPESKAQLSEHKTRLTKEFYETPPVSSELDLPDSPAPLPTLLGQQQDRGGSR